MKRVAEIREYALLICIPRTNARALSRAYSESMDDEPLQAADLYVSEGTAKRILEHINDKILLLSRQANPQWQTDQPFRLLNGDIQVAMRPTITLTGRG